jgi:hypothetical protein
MIYRCHHDWVEEFRYKTWTNANSDGVMSEDIPISILEQCKHCYEHRIRTEYPMDLTAA